jgi:hypothetical protein
VSARERVASYPELRTGLALAGLALAGWRREDAAGGNCGTAVSSDLGTRPRKLGYLRSSEMLGRASGPSVDLLVQKPACRF